LKTIVTVLTACLCISVCSTICHGGEKPQKKLQPHPLKSSLSEGIVNSDWDRCPIGFQGLNPVSLYNELLKNKSKIIKKNEFETTEEYESRKRSHSSDSLSGSFRLNSVFAIPILADVLTSYDADKELLTVKFNESTTLIYDSELESALQTKIPAEKSRSLFYEEKISGESIDIFTKLEKMDYYIGSNAFGATARVTRKFIDSLSIAYRGIFSFKSKSHLSINMDPAQAKIVKDRGRLLQICQLEYPYIGNRIIRYGATISKPIDAIVTNKYIAIRPIELWFYDRQSGEIFYKEKVIVKYDDEGELK
jgi:hypothetical protein